MLMKTPRSVNIEITAKCNLRCQYCSHFESPGDVESDLQSDQWLKFFQYLGKLAVMNVCLSGGEPLSRVDLKELIRGLVKNRMRFSILTNGTLVTEEMAEFIASTRRCNYVQVSIDGSNADIHDECRGKGTFHKAIKGIKLLQQHKAPVTARVTIHKHNFEDLGNIAALLLEEIGLSSFSTNSVSYMGLCRKNEEKLILNPMERSMAIETLLKLQSKFNGRINAMAGPLAEGKMWINMADSSSRHLPGPSAGGRLSGCGCVMNEIAVRSDGAIVPCIHLSHLVLGRINQDDLQKIWQNHPEMTRLRERRKIPLTSFDFCKGCEFIPYCTGNCPALAYNLVGQENHPSPDACLKRFLEGGGWLPRKGKHNHG